jgi:hypothetical protein
MRHNRPALPFLAFLAVTLACGLPSGSTPVPPATATSPTPGPDTVADLQPAPAGGFTMIEEEPPPASMVEILETKVASGEWTEEQGLIAGLKVLAGEVSLTDAFGESPWTGEGTGILNLSFHYLTHGSDASARAEIERLLAIVAPSPERMLEFAEPEGAQTRRPAGLAAASPLALEECQKFFEEGFTGFPSGQKVLCLLYKEQTLGGYKARIFYPSWWTSSDPQWPYLQAAHEAVAASWNLFSTFGEMRAIDVVFTVLGDQEDPSTGAVAPGLGGAQSCQIAIYPGALKADSAADQKSGVALGAFKQIVAHEMFHCFQSIRFPAHTWNVVDWGINDWWGESTADYFSNLVYPTVNLEWETAPQFALGSTKVPIFGMSYPNSVFFQHMGNTLGNQAILDLIGSLPPDSLAGQRKVVSAYAGMDDFWHEFGQLFVDGRIPDTSGPFLPSVWPSGISVTITAPEAKVEVGALPFTLARRILTFKNLEPLKKGWAFQTSVTEAGPPGRNSAQLAVTGSSWGALPPSISSACGNVIYIFLATTTVADPDVYEATVEVKAPEEAACDSCLIGTWDLNLPSFTEYSEAPFAETPDFYSFDSAGGLWRYRFHADGTMRGEFDFFYTYSLNQAGGEFGADITTNGKIDIDGTGEGTYLSDGLSNLTFSLVKDNVSLTDEIYINGQKLDASMFGSMSGGYGFATGDTTVYSCDAEVGELLISVAPQANLPPIQYDRVSTDPNKP